MRAGRRHYMRDTIIRVGNAFSKIDCDPTTLYRLDSELAVKDPGAFWARRYNPNWDGYWHFVNIFKKTFPTGLLDRVLKILPLSRVFDERIRPPVIPFRKDILHGVVLADHQCESVETFLKVGRGIIATSVASGKTEQGIAIACHIHGKCVWLTHRRELLHQTAERIKWRTGETAALIGDGIWDDVRSDHKFIVAMPQTILTDISRFERQTKDASLLVVDECHTASAANEWYKAAQLVPAYFRVGFTGTPEIGDPVRERRLEAATGKILIHIRSGEMAKRGWVVPAEVIYHKVHTQPVRGVDYITARRMLIEENAERNARIVELALEEAQKGRRVLIICDTVKHARVISEVLNGENVRSKMLCGRHSSYVRSQAKKDLKSGALEVMITTPIWDVGLDVPELEVVILAAGGKSSVRVIQRAGRALRMSPKKSKATIHDFWDEGSGYTLRHSMERMKTCRKEGFEVRVESGVSGTLV